MGERIFDSEPYRHLDGARGAVLRRAIPEARAALGLRSAVDVGCGVGTLSALLAELGLEVTAVDARAENVEEGARRHPGLRFVRADAEDPELGRLGRFDLVACFGLLYHLENPFRAIRNLHLLTGRLLLIETACLPGTAPTLELRDEWRGADQGLGGLGFYPTEAALVKMLRASGFSHVHPFAALPDHPHYHDRPGPKARTMVAASFGPLAFGWLAGDVSHVPR
jgi:SAM-dependent methyltransferase